MKFLSPSWISMAIGFGQNKLEELTMISAMTLLMIVMEIVISQGIFLVTVLLLVILL